MTKENKAAIRNPAPTKTGRTQRVNSCYREIFLLGNWSNAARAPRAVSVSWLPLEKSRTDYKRENNNFNKNSIKNSNNDYSGTN